MLFRATAEIISGFDIAGFRKYQKDAAIAFIRVAVRRFVSEAVKRIPIRTGFVRGAFSLLEADVGAGGATSKFASLSRKIEHHEKTLSKHKENLARTQADILSVPPKSSSAGEKGVDLERELHKKLSKITKQYREGNISKARYQQKKEEAREEIFKKASAQKDNPTGKSKYNYGGEYGRQKGFEKGGKVQATADEKRAKLLTKLQKAEAYHTQRISKLESRLSDLRGRSSKFKVQAILSSATSEAHRLGGFKQVEQGRYTPEKLRAEREGIRKAIRDQQRAPLNALGLVEYYSTGKGTKVLKTARSGAQFAKYEFKAEEGKYSFELTIDISYFNDQDTGRNRWSGPSAPWLAFETGRKAMAQFLREGNFGKKLLKTLFTAGFVKKTRFKLTSHGLSKTIERTSGNTRTIVG